MSVSVRTELPQDSSPVLAEVVRGGMVESRHHASVAVVDAHGGIVRAWGDVELPIYGRSAIKPLLAIPLVESGAADRFKLGQAEIALATASHNAEPRHLETVKWTIDNVIASEPDMPLWAGFSNNEIPVELGKLLTNQDYGGDAKKCMDDVAAQIDKAVAESGL